MDMKSLFHPDYEAYTPEAIEISNEIDAALWPIIQRHKVNHPIREIGILAMNCVNALTAQATLSKGIDAKKAERKNELSSP